MGSAKRWLEEERERGFTSGNKSLICQRHFQNYAIKEFIESNGRGGKCKYCGDGYSEEESPLVVSFDELMVLIVDGISRAFLVRMEHQSASLCIL